MLTTTKKWLHGLFAALIGGGANGIITAFTSVGIDPDHFNFKGGLHDVLLLSITTALVSGILSAAFFLKQSPLPADATSAT